MARAVSGYSASIRRNSDRLIRSTLVSVLARAEVIQGDRAQNGARADRMPSGIAACAVPHEFDDPMVDDEPAVGPFALMIDRAPRRELQALGAKGQKAQLLGGQFVENLRRRQGGYVVTEGHQIRPRPIVLRARAAVT